MTKRNMAPWLGALVATPALTLNVAPAAASSMAAPQTVSAGAEQRAALRTGLLSMSLDEKLVVAGARIGADPLLLATGSSSGERGAAPRTNTDIPECHTPTGFSGAKTKGGHRMSAQSKTLLRTNTNIPECQGAGASALKHGANTSTCSVQPYAQTAGSTKTGMQTRTSVAAGICIAPAASAACGSTKSGQQAITKGAITKGSPNARCGATQGSQQAITKGAITKGSLPH